MRRLIFIFGLTFALVICQGQIPGIIAGSNASSEAGFPQILAGTSQGADADPVISRALTIPTNTVAGNLILFLVTCDGTDVTDLIINTGVSGLNWNVENRQQYGVMNNTTEVIWKVAEGGDALTITSTAEKIAYIGYRISGFDPSDPITVTNTTGAKTTNWDPPSNTGLAGAVNYLWIVFASSQNNPEVVASAAPTDFSNLITQIATSASQPSVSTATREYNTGGAYDPGTFTANDAWWLGYTIIVNPL